MRKPLETKNPAQLAAERAAYDARVAEAGANAAAARKAASDKAAADTAAKAAAAAQARANRVVQKAANIAAAEPYFLIMQEKLDAWKVAKWRYAARPAGITPSDAQVLAEGRTAAWDNYRAARDAYKAMPK